ncbi:MAG: winged helix-turn-helix domain-containing protein [Planctomycetota bacterium]
MAKGKKIKNECKTFKQNLTDYFMGDTACLDKANQGKFFGHLRECASCRQELFDWENVYGALVTKQTPHKPETKKRMNDLRQKMLSETAQLPYLVIKEGKVISADTELGDPSGLVWRCVAKHGVVKLADLPELTNLPAEQAFGAYGWLARENKLIIVRKDNLNKYICLTEGERKQIQA